jgi:hypothetical protein
VERRPEFIPKLENDDIFDYTQENSIDQEDDKLGEVEAIKDVKIGKSGDLEYLVKWTGYNDRDNTWEIEANLEGAKEALSQFYKAQEEVEPLFSEEQAKSRLRDLIGDKSTLLSDKNLKSKHEDRSTNSKILLIVANTFNGF